MFDFLRELPLNILRVFSETFEWAIMSFSSGRDDDDDSPIGTLDEEGNVIRRPLWRTLVFIPLMIPVWIFKFCLAIVIFPFAGFGFEDERRTRFLFGLPALAGIFATIAVSLFVFLTQDRVTSRYVRQMQSAMLAGDFKLASTIGGRLMTSDRERKPEIAYQYAVALGRSNDTVKANAILNQIAPDNTIGFAPAHLLRALQTGFTLGPNPSNVQLEKLHWHLKNSGGEDNEQILLLWSKYFQYVEQIEPAIEKLGRAANLNPSHYLSLSELYRSVGNDAGAKKSLEFARDSFQRLVETKPLDMNARIALALTLARLSQVDEAEKVLQSGLKISRDPGLLRAMADFYLSKFDEVSKRPDGMRESFDYLDRAIRLDPLYTAIYDRLIRLYGKLQSEEEKSTIIKLLEEMIVEGKNPATAHFALSSVLSLSGKQEECLIHLQQAFRISSNMPVVCNNLAWMLATSDPPKLDEALQLSQQAVKANPTSVNFHDTLGTILLLQGKNEDAIVELEYGLDQRNEDKELHAKLAKAYAALGNKEIARMHLEKSK